MIYVSKIDRIIALLPTLLGNPYVWGGKGESLTGMKDPEKWITAKETGEGVKQVNRALAFFRKVVASGKKHIQAFDCSGLVTWSMKQVGISISNHNADTLYGQCAKIRMSELKPGDNVFIGGKGGNPNRMKHIGWFIGKPDAKAPKGYTIEAYGRDKGVVMLPLVEGEWTHAGRHPKVLEAPVATPKTEPQHVLVLGSVKIRNAPSTKGDEIRTAKKGEKLKLISHEAGRWHEVEAPGLYISDNPRLTKLV